MQAGSGKDQEPPSPYQAGYTFGDQYREGPGAMLVDLHPTLIDHLVSMGEAMWTGGAECERLASGTFDGVRFKEGFVTGFYGRVSEEDLHPPQRGPQGRPSGYSPRHDASPAGPSPTVPPRTTASSRTWWVFPPPEWSGHQPQGRSDFELGGDPRSLHAPGCSY